MNNDHAETTRCEICETSESLHACAPDDQPTLWFCTEHYEEHKQSAHPELTAMIQAENDLSFWRAECRAIVRAIESRGYRPRDAGEALSVYVVRFLNQSNSRSRYSLGDCPSEREDSNG